VEQKNPDFFAEKPRFFQNPTHWVFEFYRVFGLYWVFQIFFLFERAVGGLLLNLAAFGSA